MAPRPNMGAENWNFLKLLKIVVALVSSTLFLKPDVCVHTLQSIDCRVNISGL